MKKLVVAMMTAMTIFPGGAMAADKSDDGAGSEASIHEPREVRELQSTIEELKAQLEEQERGQLELLQEIERLQSRQQVIDEVESHAHGYPTTDRFLVEPSPSEDVSYTQDAMNAQGDSTMVFTYSPSQLYKIYCKLNYLTDLQLKKGEQVTYVGGGDTAKWMLDSATVDGTPHIYLKPVARGACTNLIINTTHHSYQVLCSEGDWYNPMITWSYGTEDLMESLGKQRQDEVMHSGTVANTEGLHFDYSISGDASWKPAHVFDDGQRTFLKLDRRPEKLPILFVKEKGRKEGILVNYHVRNNTFIVDRTFERAELRLNDETVKIRKK